MVDTIRMKRPTFPQEVEDHPTGHVTYDDRGNAVWQWRDESALIDELAHPKLALDEGFSPPPLHTQTVPGMPSPLSRPEPRVKGFNPYERGPAPKTEARPKKDLRALSQWIELKKKRGEFPGK